MGVSRRDRGVSGAQRWVWKLAPPVALVAVQLAEGYAVAASSYSLNGWAVFNTVNDNKELLGAFEAEVGAMPDQILMTGGSLGGLVTVQMLEEPDLKIAGALPICGVLGGSLAWDGALDLRLIYDSVCAGVPGGEIPGGATGLPENSTLTEVELIAAVNACTGLVLPAEARTPAQQMNLDRIIAESTIPESFIATDMAFATGGMQDLVFDPDKLGGASALDNFVVDYMDPGIDMTIERLMANPRDRKRFHANFIPTGIIDPDTKILSIHTDKDGLVLVEHERFYQDRVPANQFSLGVVVEDEPSHCGFTEAEVVAAWESLRGWVAGLAQPTATTLQATCEGLVAGTLAEGPCRFDPAFVVQPLSTRIPLRAGVFDSGFERQGFDRILD